MAVAGETAPPFSETRSRPPATLPRMMSPWRFHDPPIAGAVNSHKVCVGPPAMFNFLSTPPASKAMNRLSGDQKNGGACGATSDPSSGRTSSESIVRKYNRIRPSSPMPRNAR